jgi:hypothetical protein
MFDHGHLETTKGLLKRDGERGEMQGKKNVADTFRPVSLGHF